VTQARDAEWIPWVYVRARRTFGRIAITNCDEGTDAMVEGALGEAHRAVQEVLGDRG
jgi:hypothetical protein